MAREVERAGLPTAYVSAIPTIPVGLGVNRIVKGVAITHVTGAPDKPPEHERLVRRRVVETALQSLQADVRTPTLFQPDLETIDFSAVANAVGGAR